MEATALNVKPIEQWPEPPKLEATALLADPSEAIAR